MMSFFEAGGFAMYPTVVFGVLLVISCGLYALRADPKDARVAMVLAGITLSSGLLGWARGMCATFRFVSHLPPAEQFTTLLVGSGESLHNMVLALAILVLAGVVAAAGVLRRAPTTSPPSGK